MNDIFFEVTRGKLKGQVLKVHQMCNDWITAVDLEGNHANNGQPISPSSTYFNVNNRMKVVELQKKEHLGSMFTMDYNFEHFVATGKFKRIRF